MRPFPYPNSHPGQIEKEITKPVEEILSTLSGVKKLNSTTTADGADFFMEFTWGQEIDLIRMQVSEKMDQVEPTLPPDIGPILIFSFNTNDIPVVQGRIAAEGVDLSQNYELLEARILNPLRRVNGVVDVGGLAQLLQSVSSNLVLGRAESGGLRYTVRSLGAFESIESLADLVIDERGLRLGEVAEITYEEPPLDFGRHLDGKYAVALDVYKESTANTVEVVHEVTRVVEEEINNDPLLKGIQLWVWEDQGDAITSGIDGLKKAGLTGALLATLSLYFFLRRTDSTVIVAMSIPFSIIATCGVMYFMGSTLNILNILSMMGLMLAVGMLVDNAIVVLESVDRRMREQGDRQKAALEGAGQVLMAVTASTVTTLIVFLPLVLGAGTALTTWLKEVGLTISIALVCSLFSSLTLIPLMSAHLLKVRTNSRNRPVEWLEERYVRLLGWTLKHRVKTFGLLVVGLIVGFLPFFAGWVDSAIFSGTVNSRLFLDYEFDDFHYKSQSEEVVEQVEAYLQANTEKFMVGTVYSWNRDQLEPRGSQRRRNEGAADRHPRRPARDPGRAHPLRGGGRRGRLRHLLRDQALRPGQHDPLSVSRRGGAPPRNHGGRGGRVKTALHGPPRDPGEPRPRPRGRARSHRSRRHPSARFHPRRRAPRPLQCRRSRDHHLACPASGGPIAPR